MISIYTDGACSGKDKMGGWGFVIDWPDRKTFEHHGAEYRTTNQRMELMAAIRALRFLSDLATEPQDVTLYSDSQYVIKGMSEWVHRWVKNDWTNSARQPVSNSDLWKQLLVESDLHRVTWKWVRGHNGNIGNEKADKLATSAIHRLRARSQ